MMSGEKYLYQGSRYLTEMVIILPTGDLTLERQMCQGEGLGDPGPDGETFISGARGARLSCRPKETRVAPSCRGAG